MLVKNDHRSEYRSVFTCRCQLFCYYLYYNRIRVFRLCRFFNIEQIAIYRHPLYTSRKALTFRDGCNVYTNFLEYFFCRSLAFILSSSQLLADVWIHYKSSRRTMSVQCWSPWQYFLPGSIALPPNTFHAASTLLLLLDTVIINLLLDIFFNTAQLSCFNSKCFVLFQNCFMTIQYFVSLIETLTFISCHDSTSMSSQYRFFHSESMSRLHLTSSC